MRSRLLTISIGLERKTLLDRSDVSRDVSWRQRIRGTPQRATMELQHSLHGCRRGSLHRTVRRRVSKALCIIGDTPLICTQRSPGSGHLCNWSRTSLAPPAVDPPWDVRGGHNQRKTMLASRSLCVRLVLADLVVGSATAGRFPKHNASRNPATFISPSFRTCRSRLTVSKFVG